MLTKMKSLLAQEFSLKVSMPEEKIMSLLEIPKDASHGDLAFPCFALAKEQKKNPNAIAQELTAWTLPKGFIRSQAVGGYLNFFFDQSFYQDLLLTEIQKQKEKFGNLDAGTGKTVVVDYSSPNVAKPMSIGHLRSTVIGQSLVNLFKATGYKTVGINYVGDWGVQFGKLAWADLNLKELLVLSEKNTAEITAKGFNAEFWAKLKKDAAKADRDSFDYLFAIYVLFHAVADYEPSLEEFGRAYFLKLENRKKNHDALTEKIVAAWEHFIEISTREYERVYKLLGTHHDMQRGESYYEDHLDGVVEELKTKGLLKESEGAQVVDLTPFDMPPCLIKKSDGATLYATRDLAAAKNRKEEFKADQLIYVVGAEQTLHFKQVFKVLELMKYSWAQDCHHVGFGLYRFKEGKMSTRRGNVVLLEDVLDRAIELVKNVIAEKNPDLKNAEKVATQVGTGAVIFHDLMNDRQKNIDFDWEKLMDFNGDTGPYVQYTHVRCCSLREKWGKEIPKTQKMIALETPQERRLLKELGRFQDVIRISAEQLKPSWMAQYLLEVSKAFNSFYFEHRVLEGPEELQKTRMILVDATREILHKGLGLLSISAPTEM